MTAAPMTGTDAMADRVAVDRVAAAAEDCPAVAALVDGPPAMAATYLPRRRVTGIRIEDNVVTIQVRLRWEPTVGRLAGQVGSAVRPLAGGHRVDIVVADITEPATRG